MSRFENYWDAKQPYEPAAFRSTRDSSKQVWNRPWKYLFIINLIIHLVIVFSHISQTHLDQELTLKVSTTILKLPVIYISAGLCYGFLAFASFLPQVLVYSTAFFELALMLVFIYLTPNLSQVSPWAYVTFAAQFVFAVYYTYRNASRAIAYLRQSAQILLRNPGLVVIQFISTLSLVILAAFTFFACYLEGKSDGLYSKYYFLYLGFSLHWIFQTAGYLNLMTSARVASNWYFLENQGSSIGTYFNVLHYNLGSASIAGLFLTALRIIKYLVEENDKPRKDEVDDGKKKKKRSPLLGILKPILSIVIDLIEKIISNMNVYGLVYCSAFNVPFGVGCDRWRNVSMLRHLRDNDFQNYVVPALNIPFYLVVSAVIYAGVHFENYMVLAGAIIAGVAWIFVSSPFSAISRSLLVFYCENPRTMDQRDPNFGNRVGRSYRPQ